LNTNEPIIINKNDNVNTNNEIFIDVIPSSTTNAFSVNINNNNEKQLPETTLSPTSSPTSSISSEKIFNETNEKLINTISKTECNSQHSVYQNETTSSSSTSSNTTISSSSSADSASIKYENIDNNVEYSSTFIQNDLEQQKQQDNDSITNIYLENTGNKRTSSIFFVFILRSLNKFSLISKPRYSGLFLKTEHLNNNLNFMHILILRGVCKEIWKLLYRNKYKLLQTIFCIFY